MSATVVRPASQFVAGVDGGQSSTLAAIADVASGRELGRGSGPPSDHVGEPSGSTRPAAAIATAIHAALRSAGLAAGTPLAAIAVGLTGFEEGDAAPVLPFEGAATLVVHDSVMAHAGALAGGHGIVTIAGTGSVVFGTDAAGATIRAGGWGFLFGDDGSAFAIGRAAVAHAMARDDARAPDRLHALVLSHFGTASLRAVQAGFASGAIGRPAIAALAQGVVELADDDNEAAGLISAGVAGLAATVRVVHRRLRELDGRRPVSYAGGLFQNATYRRRFAASLGRSAMLVDPKGDAVDGAVRLAVRLAADSEAKP